MSLKRTGNYVKQLTGDLQYKAFIPNNLPFNIENDNSLLKLLSESTLSIGRLDGVAENLPDIEGTQATFSLQPVINMK